MILDIDPKVDYAFKHVHGREENRDVLESILEAVLADTEFGTVTDQGVPVFDIGENVTRSASEGERFKT